MFLAVARLAVPAVNSQSGQCQTDHSEGCRLRSRGLAIGRGAGIQILNLEVVRAVVVDRSADQQIGDAASRGTRQIINASIVLGAGARLG